MHRTYIQIQIASQCDCSLLGNDV